MPEPTALEQELLALGRSLVTEPPRDDLAALVLARVADDAAVAPDAAAVAPDAAAVVSPVRRRSRRLGWAVAAAVVLVLAVIPPVRAAVVELLRVGGIVVREEPPPSTPPLGTPSASAGSGATSGETPSAPEPVTLHRAEQLIGADIALPTALGAPTLVTVTHDGRVAEVHWDGPAGRARLEVFVGSLSWGFVKTVWQAVTPTRVAGHEGIWFTRPHLIEWVDRDGATHSETPRLAGPTLAWVVTARGGEVTYRLEGPGTLAEALRVADSSR